MINDGHGHFTDETRDRGLFDPNNDANGATFADYDNDGDLDLFVPPKSKERSYIRVYRNRGNGYFDEITDVIKIWQWGFSTHFLDADNDGDLDIIAPKTRDYITFYLNNGDGAFNKQSDVGIEKLAYDPRGGAVGDIDDDGDLDFYYTDANKDADPLYSNRLFRNDLKSSNRWLKITGRGPGGDMGGFGTKIWVYDQGHVDDPNSLIGYKQVINSYGYLCQDDPEQHFGIGDRDTVDVKVKLLDGTELYMLNSLANSRLFFCKPWQMSNRSGDGQRVSVGSVAPQPLAVQILSKSGEPVHGAPVMFVSTDASSKFIPASTVYSDKDGYASVNYRLGFNESQIITASCPRIPGSTISFNITGTGANIGSIEIVSGDNQQGQASYNLAQPLVVKVKDNSANLLADAAVHFQVVSSDGLVNGQSFYEVVTDANGKAQVNWQLGSQTSATQTVDVYPLAKPTLIAHFKATTFGPAAKLIWMSASSYQGKVNTYLPDSLAAKITDANDNPLRGMPVAFEVTAGDGRVNGEIKITASSNSHALAKARWKLGKTAGTNNQTLTVSAAGLAGSPITVGATALPGNPTVLIKVSGDNQAGEKNKKLPLPLVVAVQDSFVNAISQQPVQFTVIKGDGSFENQKSITISTDGTGKASAFLTLGEADTSFVEASSSYLGNQLKSPQQFILTGIENVLPQLTKIDGDLQKGIFNSLLPAPFRVRYRRWRR